MVFTIAMNCLKNRPERFQKLCIGYMLVLSCDLSYIISAITAQLSMANTAVFQLNFTWNLASTVMAAYLLFLLRQDWIIKQEHHIQLFITAIFDYINSTCYFLAAVFIPVGNSEGVFVCMLIMCTTTVDLIRGRINKESIVSALMASTGVILLVQPWSIIKTDDEMMSDFKAPCQVLNKLITGNYSSSSTDCYHILQPQLTHLTLDASNTSLNYSTPYIAEHPTKNLATNFTSMCKHNKSLTDDGLSIHELGGLYTWIGNSKHSQIYGYLLVAASAIAETVNSNTAQDMMETYPVAALIFWASAIQTVFSFLLTFSLSTFPGFGGWSFPTTKYCSIFTFMYTIFVTIMDVTDYYAYDFLPVSQVAVMQAWITIVLYICQRTFLFNEGNANWMEMLGAGMAFAGSAICPLMELRKTNKEKKSYTELTADE